VAARTELPATISRPPAAAQSPRTLREALPVFLGFGSPRLLLTLLAGSLAVRLALGGFTAWDLVPLAGLALLWPLNEWLIHVFILHAKPLRVLGRTLDLELPRKHREHHGDPWKLELLFIPMSSFVYSLPLLGLVWFVVTPSAALAWTGITAHLALALHYEWVHFLVHTRVVPRTRLYQRLWKNHRRHHFKNEHYWFGVTMLSGDRLLGTGPAHEAVPTSPTARTLEGVGSAG
jgi:hypothetical protein